MATFYWVGGSGTWDLTTETNWSETSGGPGGQGVPTQFDDVVFDNNSDAGAGFTVSLGVNSTTGATIATCRDITVSGLEQTMTLAGTSGVINYLTIYGSLFFPPTNLNVTTNTSLVFYGPDDHNITCNGNNLPGNQIFQQVGDYYLNGAYTTNGIISHEGGGFFTVGYSVTAAWYQATGTANKLAQFYNSQFLFYGSTPINITGSNLTLDTGTSTIISTNVSPSFVGLGSRFYDVTFNNTDLGTVTIDSSIFNNLSVTSPTGSTFGYRKVNLSGNITVNGTLTLGAANTPLQRVSVASSTYRTARTITAANVSPLSDVDFRDITMTNPVSGIRLGNNLGNTGITFDAGKNVFWNLPAGGNWTSTAWALSSGGSVNVNNFPLPQDNVNIVDTGLNASATITIDYEWRMNNLSFASRTLAATIACGANDIGISGNLTLSSALTWTGTGTLSFVNNTPSTLTSAGKTLQSVNVLSAGSSLTLNDALSCANLTITAGTFNTSNFNVTSAAGLVSTSTSYVRAINLGTSTVTLSGTTPVNFSATNLTATFGSSTLICNQTAAMTFTGGGLTYGNVSFTSNLAAAGVTMSGTNTFANLTIARSAASGIKSIGFTNNITVTGTLDFGAAVSGVVRTFIFSNTIFTQRTITAATLANFADIDIRDIQAAGAATWSGTRIGDVANNANITFTTPKTVYWNLAAGGGWNSTAWALSSGATPSLNNFPLSQDTAIVENIGLNASATITLGSWNMGSLNCSTRTLAMTFAQSNTDPNVSGDIIISSAVTWTSTTTPNINLYAVNKTSVINSAGVNIPSTFNIYALSGTVRLLNNLNTTNSFSTVLLYGTLDLNGFTLSTRAFFSNYSVTRSVAFGSTGQIIITYPTSGTSATVMDVRTTTGLSVTGTNPIIDVNAALTGTATRTIQWSTSGTSVPFPGLLKVSAGSDFVTISGRIKDVDFTGFSGSGNLGFTLTGNLTLSTGMSTYGGGTLTMNGGVVQSLTTFGKTIQSNIVVSTSSLTLSGNLSIGSIYSLTLTSGTFDANGFNVSTGSFNSSNSNVRTLNMGSGTWSILATNTTVWDLGTTTNLTFNSGTSTLEFAANTFIRTASVQTVQGGNLTYYNLTWPGTVNRLRLTMFGANTFNNFTATPSALGNKSLVLADNLTVNGTFNVSGHNYYNRFGILGDKTDPITGYQIPIQIAANNISSLSYVDFRGITAAGNSVSGGNWTGTNLGNCTANSNINFDAPKTVYWNNTTALSIWGSTSWANTSGGTPNDQYFPLPQDTAIFDNAGVSENIIIGIDRFWYSLPNMDFSRVSKRIILYTGNNLQTDCYGNMIFSPSMVVTGTGRWYIASPISVTCAGLTLPIQFNIAIYNNGAVTLNDNFAAAYFLGSSTILTTGILDLNEYTFRCQTFSSSGSRIRTIDFGSNGTSKIIIDGNNTTVFTTSTASGLETIGTPNVEFTYTGRTGTRTITAGVFLASSLFNFKILGGSDRITTGGTTQCRDLDFSGFTGTFLNVTRKLWGDVTYSPGMTISSGTGIQTFSSYASGITTKIITRGKLLDFPITIDSPNSIVQLQDALTMGSTRTLNVTNGTFDLNNYTATTGLFNSSNTNTRAIDFDTSRIIITSNNATVFDVSTMTGLSLIGKPTVDLVYGGATGTRSISVGGTAGTTSAALAIDFNILAGTDTISIFGGTNATYGSINFTGFSGTFGTASTTRNIYGSLILSPTMAVTSGSGVLNLFKSGIIRSYGKVLNYPITINAPNQFIELDDALNIGSNALILSAGSFDTHGYNLTIGSFSSATSLSRALILGNSNITVTSTPWNIVDAELIMTVSAGRSTITLTNTSATFTGGVKQYHNLIFSNTSVNSVSVISDSNIFNNVTFYGPSTVGRSVVYINANQTINGSFNVLETGNQRRIHLISLTRPIATTINAASTSALSDIEFKNIYVIGASAPWSGTRLSDCGDNQNITFDSSKIVYWNKPSGGNWSDNAWATSSGGTASLNNYPLAQDIAVFNNTGLNSGSTLTYDQFVQIKTLDFSALTNNVTVSFINSVTIYGDLLLSSSVTTLTPSGYSFDGSGVVQNITSNGSILGNITIDSINNGEVKLIDDAVISGSVTLVSGKLNLNDETLTTPIFQSNYPTRVRSIDFKESGIIYLTGNNTTIWGLNSVANFIVYGTSNVTANYNGSVGIRTFAHSNVDTSGTDNNVINLYVTAGTDTLATSGRFRTIDLTGFSGTLGTNNRAIFGDLILSPTMSTTSTNSNTEFLGTGNTQNFITNGVTFPYNIIINKPSGEVVMQGALDTTVSRTITLTNGTFTANNYNITTGSFVCAADNPNSPVLNMGTGTWTILASPFDTRCVGLTINASTSTVDMASAISKTFAAQSGGTFYNVRNTGVGEFVFTRSANYNDLTSTVSPATIKFSGGFSYFKNFSLANAGNITIGSATPGTKYTLINRSSGGFNLSNFTISDVNAMPAEWWVAQTSNGNIDAGNNTGIVFAGAPRRSQMLAMF